MEIRELKARDVKTLAKMLGKLKSSSIGDLFALIENKSSDPLSVGITIFRVVAADLTDDIYSWMADLAGVTVEQFDDMPVNAPIEIIKQLVKRGDFRDFFASAMQQAKKESADTMTLSSSDMAGPMRL